MDKKGWTLLTLSSFVFGILAMGSTLFVRIAVGAAAITLTGNLAYLSYLLAALGIGCGVPELFKNATEKSYPILGIVFSMASTIIVTALLLTKS